MIDTLAKNVIFTENEILLDISGLHRKGGQSNYHFLKQITIAHECLFAYWAQVFGKKEAVLNCFEEQFRISANLVDPGLKMNNTDETIQIANMLWFGNVPVTPELFRLAADLIENPRKAGINRLPDERQIILTNENGFSLKNATLEEAVTWSRSDYWHSADLIEFRQRCRQELSDGGESFIEHSYRAFDPTLGPNNPTFGNWVRMTQRYKLFDGNDGNYYQLCEVLDMQQLELQTM